MAGKNGTGKIAWNKLRSKDGNLLAQLSKPKSTFIIPPATTIDNLVSLSEKFSSLLKDIGSDKFLQSLVLIDLLEKNPELKDYIMNRFG